jgi:hypothetical protein
MKKDPSGYWQGVLGKGGPGSGSWDGPGQPRGDQEAGGEGKSPHEGRIKLSLVETDIAIRGLGLKGRFAGTTFIAGQDYFKVNQAFQKAGWKHEGTTFQQLGSFTNREDTHSKKDLVATSVGWATGGVESHITFSKSK